MNFMIIYDNADNSSNRICDKNFASFCSSVWITTVINHIHFELVPPHLLTFKVYPKMILNAWVVGSRTMYVDIYATNAFSFPKKDIISNYCQLLMVHKHGKAMSAPPGDVWCTNIDGQTD